MEDDEAQDRYPKVMEFSQHIVKMQRQSAMKDESARNLLKVRKNYGDRNENTFLHKFWSKLIREERDKATEFGTDLLPSAWEKSQWDKDDLDDSWNQPFKRNSIPQVDTSGDEPLKQLLDKNPRIKNPQPDIVYGLTEKCFSQPGKRANELYDAQTGISKGIRHPFFFVEAKTNGIMGLVECQCARGGSALVSSVRQLIAASGIDTAPGADLTSAVFSLALIPVAAKLYIHWAEVAEDGKTVYHMHRVRSYALEEEKQLVDLRHDLDNILDWGTVNRKTWVKDLMDTIWSRVQAGAVESPVLGQADEYDVVLVGSDVSEDELQSAMQSEPGPTSKKRKV